MAGTVRRWRRRHFPFNAAQTISILGEIGPLFAMFLVNGVHGIIAGTWALILSTIVSLAASLWVLGRPPVMPFIAGAVSVAFAALTLITGNAMWVQIKVTLFNALLSLGLWLSLKGGRNFFRFVFASSFYYTEEGWYKLTRNVALFFLAAAAANEVMRLSCAHAHLFALRREFTGIDLWILFKIFFTMPATALFFFWQVRLLQRYRLPASAAAGGRLRPRS